MLQMTITKQNAPGIEEFVETVKDWPITGWRSRSTCRAKTTTAASAGTICASGRGVRRVIAVKRSTRAW